MKSSGVFVKIYDTIVGFIPRIHLADKILLKPEKHFRKGDFFLNAFEEGQLCSLMCCFQAFTSPAISFFLICYSFILTLVLMVLFISRPSLEV